MLDTRGIYTHKYIRYKGRLMTKDQFWFVMFIGPFISRMTLTFITLFVTFVVCNCMILCRLGLVAALRGLSLFGPVHLGVFIL